MVHTHAELREGAGTVKTMVSARHEAPPVGAISVVHTVTAPTAGRDSHRRVGVAPCPRPIDESTNLE